MVDVLWLVVLIAATSFWCARIGRSLSATFDEPTYLEDGLRHWRTGSYKPLMRLGTMPLAIDAQTLPLYIWERSHGTTLDLPRDIDWMLAWARSVTLLFWALLLAYVFLIARSIGGHWAGRIASAMVAFEPTFLAHAALATADIPLAAMLAVFAHEFAVAREKRWPRRLGIPSVLLGLAILAKASALAFGPIIMMAVEFHRLWLAGDSSGIPNRDLKARIFYVCDGLWKFRRDLLSIVGMGIAVTFLYCRSDWTTEPTFITWAQALKPGTFHDTMLWISEHLRIFTNAGEGIAQQVKHNIRGHGTYILGRTYPRSVWYYFPVALSIKCSIAFLALPLLAALARRRALFNWPFLAAMALLAYSLFCRVQIGIRFMLPLMAFAAAGCAPAIAGAMRETGGRWRKIALGAITGCALCYACACSIVIGPDALCFTNEIWGGVQSGYWWLSDSNYDWGQGLKKLIAWRNAHGVDTVDVCYFGLDPRMNIPPLRSMPLNDPDYSKGKSWEEVFQGKCVAVSTTALYGPYHTATGIEAMEFLKGQKPTDRTTTYFIYDFRPPLRDSR